MCAELKKLKEEFKLKLDQRDQRISGLNSLLDSELSAKAALKSQLETKEKAMLLEVKLAQAKAEARMQGKVMWAFERGLDRNDRRGAPSSAGSSESKRTFDYGDYFEEEDE